MKQMLLVRILSPLLCGHVKKKKVWKWRIIHVQREANGVAHTLAKEATRTVMDKIWMEESPICIFNICLFIA
jgi:hypothetical protein